MRKYIVATFDIINEFKEVGDFEFDGEIDRYDYFNFKGITYRVNDRTMFPPNATVLFCRTVENRLLEIKQRLIKFGK